MPLFDICQKTKMVRHSAIFYPVTIIFGMYLAYKVLHICGHIFNHPSSITTSTYIFKYLKVTFFDSKWPPVSHLGSDKKICELEQQPWPQKVLTKYELCAPGSLREKLAQWNCWQTDGQTMPDEPVYDKLRWPPVTAELKNIDIQQFIYFLVSAIFIMIMQFFHFVSPFTTWVIRDLDKIFSSFVQPKYHMDKFGTVGKVRVSGLRDVQSYCWQRGHFCW